MENTILIQYKETDIKHHNHYQHQNIKKNLNGMITYVITLIQQQKEQCNLFCLVCDPDKLSSLPRSLITLKEIEDPINLDYNTKTQEIFLDDFYISILKTLQRKYFSNLTKNQEKYENNPLFDDALKQQLLAVKNLDEEIDIENKNLGPFPRSKAIEIIENKINNEIQNIMLKINQNWNLNLEYLTSLIISSYEKSLDLRKTLVENNKIDISQGTFNTTQIKITDKIKSINNVWSFARQIIFLNFAELIIQNFKEIKENSELNDDSIRNRTKEIFHSMRNVDSHMRQHMTNEEIGKEFHFQLSVSENRLKFSFGSNIMSFGIRDATTETPTIFVVQSKIFDQSPHPTYGLELTNNLRVIYQRHPRLTLNKYPIAYNITESGNEIERQQIEKVFKIISRQLLQDKKELLLKAPECKSNIC